MTIRDQNFLFSSKSRIVTRNLSALGVKKEDMIILLWRIPLDFCAVAAAWFLGYFLRPYTDLIPGIQRYFPAENLPPLEYFLPLVLFSAAAFVLLAAFLGEYRFSESFEPVQESLRISFAVFIWGMLIVAWYALFRHELIFSRIVLAHAMIFSAVFVLLIRFFLRMLQVWNWRRGRGRKNIVLVGNSKYTELIQKELRAYPQFQILDIVEGSDLGVLEGMRREIDELWRCDPQLSEATNQKIREICDEHHLLYRFIPREKALSYAHLELALIGDIPFLVARPSTPTLWQRVLKRLFDLIFSAFLLIVLLPLFLIFALFIKLDSRGPVFFKSTRLGRLGKPFSMWKFRSMVTDAERQKRKLLDMSHRDGPLFKVRNDPRVTLFGRFLRRFSFDELPNFFNVLKGDMSLVGPRPHLPDEVQEYESWQKRVLRMKPGVTGLAQISGRSDLPFDDEVRLDLYYMENWTFWRDLKIILKTILVVLSQRGAD